MLLNTIAKLLSSCITEDLAQMSKAYDILPTNHFRCRPSRTTSDSLHYVMKFIKDTWRKRVVVSALFLDIKSTFPSVILTWLIHNMRHRGVPSQYTNWLRQEVEGRHTTLKFDGYVSEQIPLPRGINQGCPLSGIIFKFYNVDSVEMREIGKGEVIAFMDDTFLLAKGKF